MRVQGNGETVATATVRARRATSRALLRRARRLLARLPRSPPLTAVPSPSFALPQTPSSARLHSRSEPEPRAEATGASPRVPSRVRLASRRAVRLVARASRDDIALETFENAFAAASHRFRGRGARAGASRASPRPRISRIKDARPLSFPRAKAPLTRVIPIHPSTRRRLSRAPQRRSASCARWTPTRCVNRRRCVLARSSRLPARTKVARAPGRDPSRGCGHQSPREINLSLLRFAD